MKINSLLCLMICLLPLNASATFSRREAEIPANSIYKSCGQYLYEQDNVLSSEKFQKATEEQQNKMLEDEFWARRKECYWKDAGWVTVTLVPSLGGFLFVISKMNLNNAVVGIGGTMAIYAVIGGLITDFTNFVQGQIDNAKSLASNIKNVVVNRISPSQKDMIEKYELQYVVKKRFIDKSLQEVLEENFIEARFPKPYSEISLSRGEKGSEKTPIQFAKNVLAMPTTKIKLHYDKQRMEKYLGTYNKKVLDQLKVFAAQHAAASTGETVSRLIIYFQGPPGVGKTRAAKHIAKALNAPFNLIKLGGKTLAEIEGDENNPGLLLEALRTARNEDGKNGKNPFILFDELDDALGLSENMDMEFFSHGRQSRSSSQISAGVVPFLLDIFESETGTWFSPYLKARVDISDVAFGAAGNVDWEIVLKHADVKYKALRDRFELVLFEGYTPEFKWQVTKNELFALHLRTYKKSETSLSDTDFTSEDWLALERMVLADKEPGFREVVRRLKRFLARKALCKYTGECQLEEFVPREIRQSPRSSLHDLLQATDFTCDEESCMIEHAGLKGIEASAGVRKQPKGIN